MILEKISLLKQQLYLVNCTRMVTNGNLMPIGSGYQGGLAALCNSYGVDVE